MIEQIERLYMRLLRIVGRGRTSVGNDTGNVQLHQVKLGALEIKDNTPRLAEYGFTSMPPEGSDAVVLFLGGDRSNGVIVATGNQTFRMRNLESGEVAIYDDNGQSIYLTKTGIVINGGTKPITITNTPKVRMETNLEVTGNIIDHCDAQAHTVEDMRTIYNSHTHGGVASGGSTTAITGQPQ